MGLYLVNKVSSSSSFIHVYISKRQCMRDTGSDECQILLLLYWYQHVRQNSNIYTLVLHRVTTKFVIWLRKWCTVANEGGTIKVPVYILNRELF